MKEHGRAIGKIILFSAIIGIGLVFLYYSSGKNSLDINSLFDNSPETPANNLGNK